MRKRNAVRHERTGRVDEPDDLRKELARLTRLVEALRAELAHMQLTAIRFGRDIEMRERGYR